MSDSSVSPMGYKIVLIGDGGVGKTAFAKRHATGEFSEGYLATVGVEVRPLVFETNYGPITFSIWDTAGQKKFNGLGDGYYLGADGVITMFSLTSQETYENARMWYKEFKKICPDAPSVLVGTDMDRCTRRHVKRNKTSDRERGDEYCEISTKTCYNIWEPLLILGRKLTGHEDLEFV